MTTQQTGSRLQKILSDYSIASRREAERMISAGRVRVNGTTAKLGQSAVPGRDVIEVDGKALTAKGHRIYIMLNKPRGYLTTVSDDRARKTVMELIADADARVYPVGRLDFDSEGLLLLTNDGEFANKTAHPSGGKIKTYEVHIEGDVDKTVRLLSRPVKIDGHTVCARDVKVISKTPDTGVFQVAIAEGRNRQIRKMCAACGVRVTMLRRISIGTVNLGNLQTGKWRYLTDTEVKSLCNQEV